MSARRSIIVALTPERVIGQSGGLPWRLSADLQRFKKLTMGHTMLMGRKTYESIGRPLPGRTSIVITRQQDFLGPKPPEHTLLAGSVEEAFQLAAQDTELFVIGGGDIYRQALPLVNRVYATWVETQLVGDTYFPEFPTSDWQLLETTSFPADAKNEYATRYCIYDRQTG
jgi:dihydrofolate reductase